MTMTTPAARFKLHGEAIRSHSRSSSSSRRRRRVLVVGLGESRSSSMSMSTPPPRAADSYKKYHRNCSRLVRTAATPPDRDPRTDAFSASTPEEWSNQTASWSSSIDRSLDDPLDWSSVNYETDFGASWWNAARRAKVGSIIEGLNLNTFLGGNRAQNRHRT